MNLIEARDIINSMYRDYQRFNHSKVTIERDLMYIYRNIKYTDLKVESLSLAKELRVNRIIRVITYDNFQSKIEYLLKLIDSKITREREYSLLNYNFEKNEYEEMIREALIGKQYKETKLGDKEMKKVTVELDLSQVKEVEVKKEKPAKIVCKVDGELIEFKNEKALKKFMWTRRPDEVLRYDFAGEVIVPFELETVK